MGDAVNELGIAVGKLIAVLGVGMDDVAPQVVNCLDRVVAGDHPQIGRVQVYGNAGGIQRIQEILQHQRSFGAGLDGKVGIHAVGVGGQSGAGLLHDAVTGMAGVGGNHADVGGDHIGLQVLGQVDDALGLFDELGV